MAGAGTPLVVADRAIMSSAWPTPLEKSSPNVVSDKWSENRPVSGPVVCIRLRTSVSRLNPATVVLKSRASAITMSLPSAPAYRSSGTPPVT